MLNKNWQIKLFPVIFLAGVGAFLTFQSAYAQQDSTRQLEINGLPYAAYQPETSVSFGIISNFSFYPSPEDVKASIVVAGIQYTLRNQYSAFSRYGIYLGGERYFQQGEVRFNYYPDRYYGTGPQTTEDDREDIAYNSLFLDHTGYRKIKSNVFAGLRARAYRRFNVEVPEESDLIENNIPGVNGYTSIGIGPAFLLDTRDNLASTYTGTYLDINAVFHPGFLGNNYPFNRLRVDARHFISLPQTRILAFQFLGLFNTGGTPPFKEMAELGGRMIMRGFFLGRYRDNVLMASQAEFRTPLFWRFGLVGFMAAGQVAPGLDEFNGPLQYAGGLGLRFTLNEKERVKIRCDFAVGPGTTGLYFEINEAF